MGQGLAISRTRNTIRARNEPDPGLFGRDGDGTGEPDPDDLVDDDLTRVLEAEMTARPR